MATTNEFVPPVDTRGDSPLPAAALSLLRCCWPLSWVRPSALCLFRWLIVELSLSESRLPLVSMVKFKRPLINFIVAAMLVRLIYSPSILITHGNSRCSRRHLSSPVDCCVFARQLLLSSLVAIVDAAAGISLHRLILLRIRSSIIAAITRGDSRSDAAAGISLRRLIVAYSHSRTYFVFCRDTIDHKRLPKSMQPPAYLFAG